MIDSDTLLGYALNALEPAEQDAVRAQLANDPAAQLHLARIQKLLAPLAADREQPAPPVNLVTNTLARLDSSLAQPKVYSGSTRRWLELAVAASIGMLAFGLVATGINKMQVENQKYACQNNLRALSVILHAHADAHAESFPQVGTVTAPTAGDFRSLLTSGTWRPNCRDDATDLGYTYTLGYRNTHGELRPVLRQADINPFTPLVADLPGRGIFPNGPISPHGRGQNVLFADHHVRFQTTPLNGSDHIYLNDDGEPRAGKHARDAVLGRPADKP